ncbi:MAG TPA: aldose 1-epimerase [Steroidobacteraceae bacterium]
MKIDEDFVVLRHESMRLTLDPQRGGSIRDFSWRGQDILRPTPAGAGDDPFEMACFPMVPYANRVANGRFNFGGRPVQLQRNWPEDPHPLHGNGWRSSWGVVDTSVSRATVQFEGGADEWLGRYRCEQNFNLTDDGLAIELSVRNLSDAPMPAMLGLHPYFGDVSRARMHALVPRVWLTDDAALPVQEAQTPVDWRFEPPRALDSVSLDNCFSGWNGTAALRWPERTVTLRATHCSYLHVYVPPQGDFFCIEPQTSATGALGRDAGEATIIAPGERFAIRVQFAVGPA